MYEWLRTSGLESQTEGFIIAAQDQCIKTNYYRNKILKDGTDPMCRICGKNQETIDHLVSGCSELAKQNVERINTTESCERRIQRPRYTRLDQSRQSKPSAEDDESEELVATLERLTRREDEITSLDSNIVNLLDDADAIEKDVEEALTLQDKISVVKTRITRYIQSKNPVRPNQNTHAESSSKAYVNLPKMTIKPFHGNPLEWQTFWDSFSATIDENNNLSNVQKMSYLSGTLKDEAARAIAGLPMTSNNYEKATQILKERFGQNKS
ncbi:uncharacterized protein LOC114574468 [Exaiptasia diaphana]|uniref:Uncharacterized protein n=1 Tax=Exaiptasia diaphana TaxID=2652724 RepID=A0A913YD29_EXADI|nr:uncharacterized protein LOC114574468 [Exaiptasia diaphana]